MIRCSECGAVPGGIHRPGCGAPPPPTPLDRLSDLRRLEELIVEMNAVIARLHTSGVAIEFGGRPMPQDPLAQEAVMRIAYRINCDRLVGG